MNKISAFSFKNWSSECIYRFVQPDRRRLNLLWKCIAIIYWTDEFDNGFVQMIKYIHFEICNPIFFFTFYARTYCAFVGFNYCSSHKSCEFSFFLCVSLCVWVGIFQEKEKLSAIHLESTERIWYSTFFIRLPWSEMASIIQDFVYNLHGQSKLSKIYLIRC